jgi:hypothetical protein
MCNLGHTCRAHLLRGSFFKNATWGGSTSGKAIDDGIYTILSAVALGTLAEISFSLRKRSPKGREFLQRRSR